MRSSTFTRNRTIGSPRPPYESRMVGRQRAAISAAILAWVIGCSPAETHELYSLVPDSVRARPRPFEPSGAARLVLRRTIGMADGEENEIFGFITDAAFGADRSVFVADPTGPHIAQFDSSGAFVRFIGRKGAGPGEILAPFRVTVNHGELAVYDQALGRITVFDTSGVFLRHVPVAASNIIGDLAAAPDGSFIITAPVGPVALIGPEGRPSRISLSARAAEAPQGGGLPVAGSLCALSGDTLVYANPWIYEILGVSPTLDRIYWQGRYESNVIAPHDPGESEVGVQPGVWPLGLACSPTAVILAYMVRETNSIYHDILTPGGEPSARIVYSAERDSVYPGFLGDISDNLLLTFRTRPFPQVSLFEIQAIP